MFLGRFCSFKRSSIQAGQNSSYLRLNCAMFTYNMAAAAFNIDIT